jgi:hypothetical protein
MFITLGALVFFSDAFGWSWAPCPVTAIMFFLFFFAVGASFTWWVCLALVAVRNSGTTKSPRTEIS